MNRVLPWAIVLPLALSSAASGAAPADGRFQREWGMQFEELDRQIRTMRKWFQRAARTVYRHESLILPGDRDPVDVVLRRTEALLGHLKGKLPAGALAAEARELAALKGRIAMTDVAEGKARSALHEEVCRLRRRIAFRNPLLNFDKILFVKRQFWPPSEGQGNHMCDQYFGFMVVPGGGLYVLAGAFGPAPRVRDVLAGAVCENGRFAGRKLVPGGFLSPDLSYDGRTVLFAYTEGKPTRYRWNELSTWHIFRVQVDAAAPRRLRQLTDGKVNDFDPCWLPNLPASRGRAGQAGGRIVFISERRGGFGRCHARPVPSFTLHTMNADGGDIRTISPHETNEWHPSVDNAGLIVYTRWDYVDRGFNQAHHPWVTTPDGRDARALHGNFKPHQGTNPLMEMSVRAVPGCGKYVATAAAHHGQAYGSLVLIDPDVEDDDRMSPVRRITPEASFPEAEGYTRNAICATAWPLDQDFHLCVYDPQGNVRRGTKNRYGIYLLDAFGNRELLYRDEAISCLSPIPLRPRPTPPVVPRFGRADPPARWRSPAWIPGPSDPPKGPPKPPESPPAPSTSPPLVPVAVVNVYDGLLAWPKDTSIQALRVIQALPKASPIHNVPFIGYGREKGARAVLGTVPVEKDGSAHFLLPAGRPVYFQALDANGLAVQSMRSATYVHAGQRLTCQGCHERRHRAPAVPRRVPLALRRAPSRIRPDVDGSNPFSFPRLVQPVLEKHCLPCHTKHPGKAPDLGRGDWKKARTRHYTSYRNLRDYAFFYGARGYGYDGWTPARTIPGRFGARASKLFRMIEKGHNKLKLPPADLHRITLWLDCNSDFFGSFEHVDAQCRGEVVRPSLE